MGKTSPREQITIRHDLRPGDLGYVTYLHGVHYARGEGLGRIFLWKFDGLSAASRLYQQAGFRETECSEKDLWGRR